MGRRLRTTVTTEYSLLTCAEQHGSACSTAYLISWRAVGIALCQGRRQAMGIKHQGKLKPPHKAGKETSKSKGQRKQKNEFLNPKVGFFCLHSAITWDLPRPGLDFCFPVIILVLFCLENWLKLFWQVPVPHFYGINSVHLGCVCYFNYTDFWRGEI